MRGWIVYGVAAIAGVTLTAAAVVMVGTAVWNRATARAVSTRLNAGARPRGSAPRALCPEHLAGLPAPVQRYFRFALTPSQPLIRSAVLRQEGEFAMRPGQWSPFTAVEHFAVHPPGFLWDASIRMAPLLEVRVRDSYLSGEGITRAAIAGLISVANLHGTAEMASGALVRYLAEAVWLPTALLQSEGVMWSPVDEIARASTMRRREVKGAMILTPWVGYFRDYRRVEGMMIPMAGEVEWMLPEGRQPYWRGRIVEASYMREPAECYPHARSMP